MHGNALLLLFVQLGVILALSRVAGWLFARLGQPRVVGEMVAGILLGPSLLGRAAPEAYASLFPASGGQYLELLSHLGVVFFLFLVGLELNPALLKGRWRAALVIGNASIVAPFALGAALTFYLYPRLFGDAPGASLTAAALFMGAAMSVTAFPVLARILTERNLHKTEVGATAITCAALNDVAAWCLLAFVVAFARAEGPGHAAATAALTAAYVALMLLAVRPLVHKIEGFHERQGRLSQSMVAFILLLVLASAAATEWIGIHALFGAFLAGCVMPKGSRFVRELAEKLEDFTVVLLLPVFFAFSGLKTHLGLLSDGGLWFDTLLVVAVACVGKIGGSALAARTCGLGWREASAIGILLNTRGLMELVILNIGRDLGVIPDSVFAMMVLMALATTALTSPALSVVYPARLLRRQAAAADAGRFSILIPVAFPKSGGPLVNIADALVGADRGRGRIFALHLRPPSEREAYRPDDAAGEPEDEPLTPLLAQAKARSIPVEPISLVTRDVPGDIAELAEAKHADLVLMGFHKPVFGKGILGGTVHRVLASCPCYVAVFVDRGFRSVTRILVPYLGGPHDRLALELAGRMARNTASQVTVLHVVPPLRGGERVAATKQAVTRLFGDVSPSASFDFRVVEDTSPVGVVVHQAQQFDLVIIGVAEEWGLESHLFGWRPERIARDCPTSLLIVRRHEGEKGGAVTQTPPRPEAARPGG